MDKIKEYLPIISIVLLILGAIRLIVFYHFFGIDITTYIDLSEVLILSLPFFFSSALFLLAAISYAVLGIVYESNNVNSTANSADLTLLKDPDRQRIRASYYVLTYLALFAMPMALIFGPSRERISYDFALILIPVCLLLPPVIPSMHNWIARSYKNGFNNELESSHLFLFTVGVLLVLFSVVYTRGSARGVLYDEIKVKMIYGGKVIETGDSYAFIGKTKNYVFLYNDNTGYADVFNLNDVKNFSIKDNEPHRRKPKHVRNKPSQKPKAIVKPLSTIADSVKNNNINTVK